MNDGTKTIVQVIFRFIEAIVLAILLGVFGFVGMAVMENGKTLIRVETIQGQVLKRLDRIDESLPGFVTQKQFEKDIEILKKQIDDLKSELSQHERDTRKP